MSMRTQTDLLDRHGLRCLRAAHDSVRRLELLRRVMDKHPGLCYEGFGVGLSEESLPELREELVRNQSELWRALLFIGACNPDHGRSCGSYGLKHIAEDLTGGYISNGVLLAAARMAQVRVKPHGNASPNADIFVIPPPRATDGARHLLACSNGSCKGACLLYNPLGDIRSWAYPSLEDLIIRAGYLPSRLPEHILEDLASDYEGPDDNLPPDEAVRRIRSLLDGLVRS